MNGRTIKDLKDLRVQGIAACYRHLGPKGPKSVGCDRLIATGQDQAILHYRAGVRLRCAAAVGCDRLIATVQDLAILNYRTIKDLKALRAFCVSACYRHLGPKGPKRLSFGCACAQTGQDLAILTYRKRPKCRAKKRGGQAPALRWKAAFLYP